MKPTKPNPNLLIADATDQQAQYRYIGLTRILDELSEGVVVIGRDNNIISISDKVLDLLKLEKKPKENQSLWDYVPELASGFYKQFRQVVKSNRPGKISDYFAPAEKWLELTVIPEHSLLYLFVKDISQEKIAERWREQRLQMFSAIMDNVIDGIICMDARGLIMLANRAVSNLTGHSIDALIGSNIGLLVPEGDAAHHEYMKKYFRSGAASVMNKRRPIQVKRKDGSCFPALLAVTEFTAYEERLFIGSFHDLSKVEQKEEEIRALAKFPTENPNPVLRIRRQGRLVYANKAAKPILDTWNVIVGDTLPQKLLNLLDQTFDQHEVIEFEEQCGDIVFSISFSPVEDEDYVNVYARDDTKRKQYEREIMQHQAELELKVEQRTQALAIAKDEAQQANRAKSTFLANMSHELRTPLNAIIGYGEMLLEEAEAKQRKQDVTDLDKILQSADYLLGLINDILDISKIESGKFELNKTHFELSRLIENVETAVRPVVQKNKNQFVVKKPDHSIELFADEIRLRQALINLISNAAKFTENGKIHFEIEIPESNVILFIVEDDGIGMDEYQKEKLFQPFSQGDTSISQKYGGTGLGLVISRKLCNLMGGDIQVESQLGQGSRFLIKLPRS